MFKYLIYMTFAKAGAPSFYTCGYKELLLEAKDYFNTKSRTATNAKEINDLSIIDSETISVILYSKDKLNLNQVSRSLRLFSMYLTDKKHNINFSDSVTGKRIFRTNASEIHETIKVNSEEELVDCDILYDLCKFIFLDVGNSRKDKLKKIQGILKEV